jgi:hypothetical protein
LSPLPFPEDLAQVDAAAYFPSPPPFHEPPAAEKEIMSSRNQETKVA